MSSIESYRFFNFLIFCTLWGIDEPLAVAAFQKDYSRGPGHVLTLVVKEQILKRSEKAVKARMWSNNIE